MSQDLLTQLAEYGTYCDERQGSVLADDVIDAIVPLPMPTHPTAPRRRWLVAVAAAALILVLIGGVTWLTPSNDSIPPTDELTETTIPERTVPVTTVPVTTVPVTPDTTVPPTTLPAGPVEITVEWTEVTGRIPPGDPFIITDGSTQRAAIVADTDDGRPLSLWNSEDGINWVSTAISLPPHPGWFQLQITRAGYWLVGGAPSALWYSPELHSGWEQINLDGLAQEAPFPLTAEETSIQTVATVGDTTLVMARYDAFLDWGEILGIEPGTYVDYDLDGEREPGVVWLSGITDSAGPEATRVSLLGFTPSASEEGLTLIDANSGEAAHFFPNEGGLDWRDVVNPNDYPYLGFEFSTLFEVTPDGLEETGPWAGSPSPRGVDLLELGDSVIVETVVDEERVSYLTRDGRTFAPHPPLPRDVGNIKHHPTSGYLFTWFVDRWPRTSEHLISTDGIDWTTLHTPVVMGTSVLHRLDGAWMIMKHEEGIAEIYVSVDGEEWHAIDPPPSNDGSLLVLAWGNRVLIPGEASSWVGTVDFGGG